MQALIILINLFNSAFGLHIILQNCQSIRLWIFEVSSMHVYKTWEGKGIKIESYRNWIQNKNQICSKIFFHVNYFHWLLFQNESIIIQSCNSLPAFSKMNFLFTGQSKPKDLVNLHITQIKWKFLPIIRNFLNYNFLNRIMQIR